MATIRMKKGDVFADICNDPECIENARKQGYSIVDEVPPMKNDVEKTNIDGVNLKEEKPRKPRKAKTE